MTSRRTYFLTAADVMSEPALRCMLIFRIMTDFSSRLEASLGSAAIPSSAFSEAASLSQIIVDPPSSTCIGFSAKNFSLLFISGPPFPNASRPGRSNVSPGVCSSSNRNPMSVSSLISPKNHQDECSNSGAPGDAIRQTVFSASACPRPTNRKIVIQIQVKSKYKVKIDRTDLCWRQCEQGADLSSFASSRGSPHVGPDRNEPNRRHKNKRG